MATPASAPTVVNIDVWSDIACPWCYVGKTRLDLAIENIGAKSQAPPIVINWHPYMIDKKTNGGGEEYLAYNRRRWGSDSWTRDLRRSGAKNGLKFGNWQWWPNTLNAHRLILYADTHGKGTEAKQLLLLKTYEEGANVSDLDVLCTVANELGLPGANEYLVERNGREDPMQMCVQRRRNGGGTRHEVPRDDGGIREQRNTEAATLNDERSEGTRQTETIYKQFKHIGSVGTSLRERSTNMLNI